MHRHIWKPLMATALLASLLLLGCNKQQQGPPPQTAPEVATVTIQPQQAVLTTELPGRTSAYRVAEIRPQVDGLLQKRLFTEGAHVEKGEQLYEIDPAPYQAAVENAQANLVSAQEAAKRARAGLEASKAAIQRHEATLKLKTTNRDRNERLFKTSAVSAMERDQAVAEMEAANADLKVGEAQVKSDQQLVEVADAAIKQAEAALKTAEINLGYTKITAPISGRIGPSKVTEGAIVNAYQQLPLAIIQQLDPIYVDVPRSTTELARLKRSLAEGSLKENGTDRVKILLEDGTPYAGEGSLKFHDVTVDPSTGSVILRVVVPNPDGTLLPGMFLQAIIEEGMREQAILVPQQAVSRDPKGNPLTLIVDADGKVQPRPLTTERALGDQWLVSSGLAAGDCVIVEGMQRVRPGVKVKAVPFEPKTPATAKAENTAQTTPSAK